MTDQTRGELLWRPGPERVARARITAFQEYLSRSRGVDFASYEDLWRWSIDHPDALWAGIWDHLGVIGSRGDDVLAGSMPDARWFPGASLSWAENALARAHPDRAVVALAEDREPVRLDRRALADLTGRVRAGLVRLGVGPGDRVAGYLPNGPEALAGLLATASLGAVWSSCAPEFGSRAVLDRFGQIEPRVLLAVDAYTYGGKRFDRTEAVSDLVEGLPDLAGTVVVPKLHEAPGLGGVMSWDELTAEAGPLDFERVPFDHPLYILYSSGTTGPPKPIVHGHGGILLEHLKALALHADLGPDDRFFWFSTTGWMMWNFLVSGLLVGATVITFDGSPAHPGLASLWEMADREEVTYFGTSAGYLTACMREGLRPGEHLPFASLRSVGSTGSPLAAEGFRWVYDSVKADLVLSSISGGTDVCTAFVGATPTLPVRAGEIPGRYLGAAVHSYGSEGREVVGEQGELVVTAPMPSMPVGFWNDPDGSRYREAYFSEYPGVWRHGDWLTIHEDGACVITGRSDATLNRGGVRLGTGELYSVVEAVPGVADSLVVHLEDPSGGPGRLILFVVVTSGAELDDALIGEISDTLRRSLSPRHVPDRVLSIPEVPRTLSGKKLEIPVKRILLGEPPDQVVSTGALANPGSLQPFLEAARSGAAS